MHIAHNQWLDEHDALAAVLHSVSQLARRLETEPDEVDFCASRALLVYLSDYPERVHHPHEDVALFERLRGRDAALDVLLQRLQAQHAVGSETVMRLAQQLNRAEFGGSAQRQKYAQQAEHFVNNYLSHMQTEEREVFPAAERLLAEHEWAEIADLLARERDPLQGVARDASYAHLMSLITQMAPGPMASDAR